MEKYMKNGILFISIILFNMLSAQNYCAGDEISVAHQNIEHTVCAGYEDYENGDIFKLT